MFSNNFKFDLFCYKLRKRTNCENGSLLGLFGIVKKIKIIYRCGDNQ